MGVPLTRGGRGGSGAISRRARAASLFPAGAAGIGVSLSGRGARPARGGGDPRRPAAGPDLLPHPL